MDGSAALGGWYASGLDEVSSDLARLDDSGRWAVAIPYTGAPVLARFAQWHRVPPAPRPAARWVGPAAESWTSSLSSSEYCAAVELVRAAIAAGDVYQANVCRVLYADLPDPDAADIAQLAARLAVGNPAPFGGHLALPDHGVGIASASPELYLSVGVRDGRRIARSGPIKGTGRAATDLTDKDAAENVMIVDLVRNDLSIVSRPGTVQVPSLLEVQQHPGLVHLVSYVESELEPSTAWPELLAATFPPGSVTGAPKIAAMRLISELEPVGRSYYCGALGWVDADTGEAELAVAIRTFWVSDGRVNFGTGAGITWSSDAQAEWRETELKAARLVQLASWQAGRP